MTRGQPLAQQSLSAPITQIVQQPTSPALSRLCNSELRKDLVLPIKCLSRPKELLHQCKGSSGVLIPTTSIVDCRDTQLTMPRSTIQRDTTWFLMPAHMSLCHILGIRTLIVIMHSNSSSLRLRINKCKYKDLKFRLKDS
jgi:hypothetical protein